MNSMVLLYVACMVYYAMYSMYVAWCTMPCTLWCCRMLPGALCHELYGVAVCCLVHYAMNSMVLLYVACMVYYAMNSMVLLCMLPGVLCHELYGVAVHVAWCTMP